MPHAVVTHIFVEVGSVQGFGRAGLWWGEKGVKGTLQELALLLANIFIPPLPL